MITHTSDLNQILGQKKTKSKFQIKKNSKNSNFEILQKKKFTRDTPSEVTW